MQDQKAVVLYANLRIRVEKINILQWTITTKPGLYGDCFAKDAIVGLDFLKMIRGVCEGQLNM